VYEELELRIKELIDGWLAQADPSLPVILTAHASVQGAVYGGERTVMLGSDLVLSGGLVRDPRLDYVALGHIHKAQNLNEKAHPPVVYPGSIERVDFGEAQDKKFFVIAHVERGSTRVDWRKLTGIRPFIDRKIMPWIRTTPPRVSPTASWLRSPRSTSYRMPSSASRRLPPRLGSLIDETLPCASTPAQLLSSCWSSARTIETRIRLPEDQAVGSLTHLELLDLYWRASHWHDPY
jgi:DNA repair protein SbcD/Mre11